MNSSQSSKQSGASALLADDPTTAHISRDLVNAVLAQLKEGVIITDEAGRIIFVNDAAKDLHGVACLDVTPDDYSKTYRLFTEDGKPHPIDELPLTRAVQRGEIVVGQRWLIRRPDGYEVVAIGDATPVRDPQGRQIGAVLTIRDDTRRRAAERELRDAEVRFRTMADNIAQLAWMARADGGLFWYNKRWYDYSGTTPDEMLGWGWRSVHHPDHLDRVVAKFKQSLQTGEPWEDTFPIRGADGAFRWFLSRALPIRDDAGAIVLWFGTNTDITDLREIQDALRTSEAQFRGTFENAAVGVAHIGFDGRFLLVNDRLCDKVGIPRDELLKLGADDLAHDNDRLADAERRAKMLDKSQTSYAIDRRLQKSDGAWIWVSETASLQVGPEGEPLYAIVVIEDITLRREAMEHQKFLMRELSHRTKNLLAVIQSIARQTGLNSLSTADFNKRFMPRLAALASSHDLLVNEEWSGVRLDELLREQLRPFLGDDAGRLELLGEIIVVTPTAAQALGLALHELATNAAKYGALSTPSGRVCVSWRVDSRDDGERRLRLDWVERNGPPVSQPDRYGFGHVVIEQAVASSLLGKSELKFERDGVSWRLDAPASCIATG